MNRRAFLRSAVAAASLPPFGAAAQPGLPIIGYLSSRSAEAETPLRAGFLEGLEQQGFVVGRNVVIEYRFSEGKPRASAVSRGRASRASGGVTGRDRGGRGLCGKPGDRNRPDRLQCRLRPGTAGASSQASTGRPATRRECTAFRLG